VGQPAGAIPVTCPRNSCMIFDRRLLHAASTNWCGDTRYFAIVGYAYRWLKPKEPLNVEAAHATATCPILKQMMRHTTSNMGLCGPSPEDTPIHPWMVKHGIEPLPYGASWATSLNASLSPADARRGGARLGGALEGDTGHSTESRPGQPLVELVKAETAPAASSKL
jgi:hypothetical protein